MAAPSLIAIAYASAEQAGAALAALEQLADEGAVAIDDAALVVRDDAGAVTVGQTRQLAVGEGVVSGGAIGLLVGILIAGPIGAAVAGMAGGAAWSARDTGLDDEDLERLGGQLTAGRACLVALVHDADWPLLAERLERYGGQLAAGEVSAAVAAELSRP